MSLIKPFLAPRGPTRSSRAYEIQCSYIGMSSTCEICGSYQTIMLVYGHNGRLQTREARVRPPAYRMAEPDVQLVSSDVADIPDVSHRKSSLCELFLTLYTHYVSIL